MIFGAFWRISHRFWRPSTLLQPRGVFEYSPCTHLQARGIFPPLPAISENNNETSGLREISEAYSNSPATLLFVHSQTAKPLLHIRPIFLHRFCRHSQQKDHIRQAWTFLRRTKTMEIQTEPY